MMSLSDIFVGGERNGVIYIFWRSSNQSLINQGPAAVGDERYWERTLGWINGAANCLPFSVLMISPKSDGR